MIFFRSGVSGPQYAYRAFLNRVQGFLKVAHRPMRPACLFDDTCISYPAFFATRPTHQPANACYKFGQTDLNPKAASRRILLKALEIITLHLY